MKKLLVGLWLSLLAGNAVAAQAPASEGHLWIAGADGARRVNIADGITERHLATPSPVDAIAVEPASGDVWLLSGNVLHRHDANGNALSSTPLPGDGTMLANMLAVDAVRGAVWAGDPLNIFRFDLDGELQQQWTSGGAMFWSAALDDTGRLWLAAYGGAWRVSAAADLERVIEDSALAATVVVADAVRAGVWLVGAHGAALYSFEGEPRVALPVQTLLDPIRAVSDGAGGLWVAGGELAAYVDPANGMNVVVMPFSDISTSTFIAAMQADDVPGSVWMAGQGRVRRVDATGARTADLAVPAAGHVSALAHYRDRTAPQIRFDFPEDHASTTNPRLRFGVSWTDDGEGADTATLRIDVDGVLLQTDCEIAGQAASCAPVEDLAEGTHYLVATIADRAGNVSDPAALHLTVEPQGPRIDSIAPAEGPVGTRVTLAGRGFDTRSPAGNRVTFNGTPAIVSRVTATQLDVIVPLAAMTGAVRIETENGAHTADQPFTVIPRENFDIDVSEAVIQLPANGYAFTVITLSSLGLIDYAQLVELEFLGLPDGIHIDLDRERLAANQPVTLAFNGTAPPGTYTVRVRATGLVDGKWVTREVEFTLIVLPPDVTTLGGRVLHADDDRPFVGALVQLGDEVVETDSSGSYLFVDPPLTGEQVIMIDGHTNNTADVHYASRIVMPVNIVPEQANRALTSYLSAVDTSRFTQIVPGHAASVTDAEIPDYELRIPEGAVLTGWDGEPIDKINVRIIAPDRLPIRPIPDGVTTKSVYLYYFFRPGGAEPSEPIPVTMRNDLGLLPGEKADLWYYDETPNPNPDSNQWRIMGQGTVSEDGLSIVSDPGVGIPRFCCGASFPSPPAPPPDPPGGDECGPQAGNPVDLASGIGSVLEDHTLGLNGLFPAEIRCGYNSNSERDGPFGTGTWMNYEWRLLGGGASYTVVTPRGTRYTLVRDDDGIYRARAGRAGGFGMELRVENSKGRLSTRKGRVMEFVIGGQRNPFNTLLMAVEDRNGNRITLTREASMSTANGRLVQVTDSHGRRWRIDYASTRRIGAITDPLGRVQTYEYSGDGRLSRITDAEGQVTEYEWTPEFIEVVNPVDCEETGVPCHVDVIPNPAPKRILAKRRADGGVTEYRYDDKGRTLGEMLPNGGEFNFSYDLVGETVTQAAVTDPEGNTGRYRFSGQGYLTRHIDALGRQTEKRYDLGTNFLRSEIDSLGRRTFYTYDTRGNRTSVRNSAEHVTVTDYHPVHNRPTRIVDAIGRETHFTYDTNGNLSTVANPLLQTTRFDYDERGLLVAVTDPLNRTTTFAYDDRGNLIETRDPLGNAWRHDYDLADRRIAATDPLGRTTRYEYDAVDRLTRILDARGGITDITYTPTGKLESVTDAKGALIETNTYDLMGNLRTKADSQGRTHHYDYDLNDNLIRHTDPKNQVTEYVYDPLDRLTRILDADGRITEYRYDLAGRLVQVLDTVSGETRYDYDNLDRLVRELTDRGMIEYEYDAADQLTRRIVNGSDITDYHYDAAGRIERIEHTAALLPLPPGEGWGEGVSQTVTYTWDAAGQLQTKTLSNGILQSHEYDGAGRLTTITYTSPQGEEIERIEYEFDKAGHVVRRDRAGGISVPETFFVASYDDDNRLLMFNGYPLSYDDNGNLISRETEEGTISYTWDAWNQLMGISGPNVNASFIYDHLGRRIEKTVNGATTRYVYAGSQVIAELSGNVRNVYQVGLMIDEVLAVYAGSGNSVLLEDALGSVIALTDDNGHVKTEYSYSPYGQVSSSGEESTNVLQYTGRENDGTELYAYRARYYDPELKRFISIDPIGFDDGFNAFLYVGGNPVDYFDPDGLEREHRKNKRKSSKGKHESGRARNARDKGGEKGDSRRRPSKKPPSNWKGGPWPPKLRLPGGMALPAWDVLQEMCRTGAYSGIGCLPENDPTEKCWI